MTVATTVVTAVTAVCAAALILMALVVYVQLRKRKLLTSYAGLAVFAVVAQVSVLANVALLLAGMRPQPWVTWLLLLGLAGWTVGWWWPRRWMIAVASRGEPGERPVLYIFRGLPGCGKSTQALSMVASVRPGMVRSNRDLLRIMMHGGWRGDEESERQVTRMQFAGITAMLGDGLDVVCDDTNLPDSCVHKLGELAWRGGGYPEVIDMRGVSLERCLAQNAGRQGAERLDPDIIRAMHAKHIAPFRING